MHYHLTSQLGKSNSNRRCYRYVYMWRAKAGKSLLKLVSSCCFSTSNLSRRMQETQSERKKNTWDLRILWCDCTLMKILYEISANLSYRLFSVTNRKMCMWLITLYCKRNVLKQSYRQQMIITPQGNQNIGQGTFHSRMKSATTPHYSSRSHVVA